VYFIFTFLFYHLKQAKSIKESKTKNQVYFKALKFIFSKRFCQNALICTLTVFGLFAILRSSFKFACFLWAEIKFKSRIYFKKRYKTT